MRIVHIITRLILGGAQENTLITVEGLQRNPEYEVTLITGPAIGPEGELVRRARDNKVNLIIIPEMRRNIFPWLDLISFIRIFFLLRKLKPDIVHTHSTKAGIFGRIAARLAGVKYIVHTIHGMPFYPYQPRIANWFYIALERLAAKVTDKIICVADAMTTQALAAGVGRPELYTTIYSALEMDKFIPKQDERKVLGLTGKDKVVGVIARLAKLKGHEYILNIAHQIIREVPEVKFLFVGDGALREQIAKEVRDRGLVTRVVFSGLVEPDRIPGMISAMNVLAHPSLREGLARALPQALMLGRPVVSFDIDGAKEVVINGKTGFLIPPPEPQRSPDSRQGRDKLRVGAKGEHASLQKLAESIIYLLKHPEEARQMGQNGKELVKQNFNANYMVERIINTYKNIVECK